MSPDGGVIDEILLAHLVDGIAILWLETVKLWQRLLSLFPNLFSCRQECLHILSVDSDESFSEIYRVDLSAPYQSVDRITFYAKDGHSFFD